MGNTIGKDKGEDSADGGQLVPHGIYKGPIDWDCRIVRKLIIERKLAPFYKGLSEYDESSDEVTLTTHNPPRNGEVKKSATSNVEANAPTNRELKRSTIPTTAGISKGKDVPQAKSLEAQLYRGAVECPICFLYYPRNINHSRCCEQPICTECFVQIKRPENGSLGANNSPAVCPFCVEPNFGVCYKPPPFSTGIGALDVMTSSSSQNSPNSLPSTSPTFLNSQETKLRRKSVSHRNPEVVTSDTIRPDWATRAAQLSRQDVRRLSGSTPTTAQRRLAIRSGNGAGNLGTQTPPSRRNYQPGGSEFNSYFAAMRSMGTDLEELMIMEAIRLSLSEQEERERRERDERERTEGGESNTSEVMPVEDTANSPSSSSGHVPLDSVERLEEDDKNSPNTIQSQDNTGTPITTITSTENITNTSVASSSSPSSSPTNSTNDPLSTPSPLPSPGTRHIIGIASTSNVPTPSFDDHTNETPPQIEQDDNEGQTSTHTSGSVDIKKAPIIIFPSNAIVSEGTVFGNKREGDSRDSRGGSWEPA